MTFTPEFQERYRVEAPLGAGGMGTVYRGMQVSLGRRVAIKALSPELATEAFLGRFQAEARAVAGIFHGNVVAVIESGVDGKQPFIIFELVDGPSLRDHLDRQADRLPLVDVLDLVSQACAKLDPKNPMARKFREATGP